LPERVVAETLLQLAQKAAAHFVAKGLENGRLDAELLLAGVLGMKRLDLYLQHDRPLTAAELDAYRAAVRRRLRREPVQYIVGDTDFRELRLSVDRRVLIPRPETEVLVGEVLRWAREAPVAVAGAALDLGTGTGAIALSLAREGRFRRVLATDISPDALDVARSNAERNALAGAVEFAQGDLWQAVPAGEKFCVIVSNPPYIAEAERADLAPEVVDFEPAEALFAPAAGLGIIERIVAGAARHLVAGGLLALEIGATQGAAVAARLAAEAGFEGVRIVADLSGRPRIAMAVRSEE
jgi:release factor glutamine methyltransferase